ncbi:MAG TPA: L,D-transpeptidase [Xanthobacteraceae bacterium]|nr:L,D-transpeptidase [Xanthobacteraceae bacterium]
MNAVRAATWVALATGFAVLLLGEASAQYYPSGPAYPNGPAYRPAPPPADDYDQQPGMYAPAPPPNYAPPPQSAYPGGPYQQQQQPYTARQQAMPPAPAAGTNFPPPADYPWVHDRNAYPGGPVANAPGPAPGPYDNRSSNPDVPRPPGVVDTGLNAPVAAPGQQGSTVAALPPDIRPEQPDEHQELAPQFKRQIVSYPTNEPAGTIIVDTPNTYLYLVLGNGQAMRYGIGVGREGFTWTGTEKISRMKEWPDWFPPKEMIERQPYLPRFMAGGPSNPLGARAMYLGHTLYRIHGTNQPSTIGTFVSSGCIRLVNEDVEDLFSRVHVGTRVIVLPGANQPPATAQAGPPPAVH